MGLKEDRMYLKEQREAREALKENARQQHIKDINEAYNKMEDLKAAHEAKIDKFYEYKNNVKKTLVTEALMNIYKESITNLNSREAALCEAFLGNYIDEVGVPALLKNMKLSESGLLIDIQDKTNEYYKKITEDATAEDPDSQTITKQDVENFWNDIDNSNDIDDITSMIRLRVSDAEQEFINKNQEDKENVKSILRDTAKRVQDAKASDDEEFEDAVEESETRLAKDKIYQIQHENRHNVFDRMVRNISEKVIAQPEELKEYYLDNGRLDMASIVETARCMYTLLEMVGTLQIENVDAQYIEDTLKSMK